jgi:hypothetical protein
MGSRWGEVGLRGGSSGQKKAVVERACRTALVTHGAPFSLVQLVAPPLDAIDQAGDTF